MGCGQQKKKKKKEPHWNACKWTFVHIFTELCVGCHFCRQGCWRCSRWLPLWKHLYLCFSCCHRNMVGNCENIIPILLIFVKKSNNSTCSVFLGFPFGMVLFNGLYKHIHMQNGDRRKTTLPSTPIGGAKNLKTEKLFWIALNHPLSKLNYTCWRLHFKHFFFLIPFSILLFNLAFILLEEKN